MADRPEDPSAEVDVVLLSWNRADDTIAAIRSVLDQRDVESRVWIVDQGSEPEQIAQLDRFVSGLSRVRLHRLPRNLGVPAGRNLASAMGRAPVIVAIDNDAEFADPYCLKRTLARFQADPALGALAFRIVNYFTGALDVTSWNFPHDPALFGETEFEATRFVGAGHALRRAAFEAAGRYDESLYFMEEEKDLAYRFIERQYRIRYDPSVVVLHKISPEKRVTWDGGRFFYLCRNVIYSDYKFSSQVWRKIRLSYVFLVKAAKQGLLLDGVRGLLSGHARGLALLAAGQSRRHLLSPSTWAYIWEFEARHYRKPSNAAPEALSGRADAVPREGASER